MLDLEHEVFVVHIASLDSASFLSSTPLNAVHPFYRPQIAGLIAEKALIKVPNKYINFANVFSPELASKLSNYTKINDHSIELVDGQQLSYKPIYSLRPVKLKTLKACI